MLLVKGKKGAEVKDLQAQLVKLGFDVSVDGIFGDKTEAAVLRVQELFGEDVDGKVGEKTASTIETQIRNSWSLQLYEAAKRAGGASAKAPAAVSAKDQAKYSKAQKDTPANKSAAKAKTIKKG